MSKRNHRYLDRIEPRNVVVRASFELQSHASLCHAVRIGSWNGSFALNLIYIRAVYRPVLDPIGYVLLPYSSRFEETAILTRNDPRDRDLVGKEREEEWNRNSVVRDSVAFGPIKRRDINGRGFFAVTSSHSIPHVWSELHREEVSQDEIKREKKKLWHERFWNGFWNGETATRHAPSMLRLYCCIVECAAKSGRGDPCYSNGERIKAARTQKRGAISVEITGRETIQK